jgi:hypothetical protein
VDRGHHGDKRWSREHGGQRMVQVIFVSNADDPDMIELQDEITRAGGTVDASFAGMRMITATVPARRVKRIARRADVEYVTPNRETAGASSHLELVSGGAVRAWASRCWIRA